MSQPAVVLASGSTVRRRMLANAGVVFRVIPADVDESEREGEGLVDRARRLARHKALAVSTRRFDSIVIGCDQVGITDDGHELRKPATLDAAREQLQAMRDREHTFTSCAAIAIGGEIMHEFEESATVRFHALTDDEIERYLALDEWRGSAGSYHFEGRGAQLVKDLQGPEAAVYGLPLIGVLTTLRGYRETRAR